MTSAASLMVKLLAAVGQPRSQLQLSLLCYVHASWRSQLRSTLRWFKEFGGGRCMTMPSAAAHLQPALSQHVPLLLLWRCLAPLLPTQLCSAANTSAKARFNLAIAAAKTSHCTSQSVQLVWPQAAGRLVATNLSNNRWLAPLLQGLLA